MNNLFDIEKARHRIDSLFSSGLPHLEANGVCSIDNPSLDFPTLMIVPRYLGKFNGALWKQDIQLCLCQFYVGNPGGSY